MLHSKRRTTEEIWQYAYFSFNTFPNSPSTSLSSKMNLLIPTQRISHESERLIDSYLGTAIDRRPQSNCQHAFWKDKTSDSALHDLVCFIERFLKAKEYILMAFLDIAGDFDNIEQKSGLYVHLELILRFVGLSIIVSLRYAFRIAYSQ